MSIYNHIPSKDLLLEVAADVAAGKPPELGDTEDFRRAVRQWVGTLWAGFRTHPWLLRIPLDHSPIGPNQLAWLDRLLQPLLKAGLAAGEARAAALHLTAVVRGTAQISMDMGSAHRTDDGRPRNEAERAQALSELINPDDYPALKVREGHIEGLRVPQCGLHGFSAEGVAGPGGERDGRERPPWVAWVAI